MRLHLFSSHKVLLALILIIVLPALFWNLGDQILIEDESIRGLVAQEMILNDNYVSPTLNSEFYYKKPPLFNWLIVLSYKLFGEVNEWSVRFPAVFSLLLFSILVYRIGKKFTNTSVAIFSALALLTNGRILFYDSMLGLIDISFSLTIFLLFLSIFHFSRKEKWLSMFLVSYGLMTIAFFFKGLPAIVFQGLTLLSWLIYSHQWRKLFSWQHLVGAIIPLASIGLYLSVYASINDPMNLLQIIFAESSKATALEHSLLKGVEHFFLFPLDLIYHFLPWSLLFLLFFRRSARAFIRKNSFLSFCLVVFLANIWVYWISPRVFPRYLFMFLPLLFYPGFQLYQLYKDRMDRPVKIMEMVFLVVLILAPVLIPVMSFIQIPEMTSIQTTVVILGALCLVYLAFCYWKRPELRVLSLVGFLLVIRILFNAFVIPERANNQRKMVLRETTSNLGEQYKDEEIAIIGKEDTYHTYSYYTNSFYLSKNRETAIRRVDRSEIQAGKYYILDPFLDRVEEYSVLDSFPIRHQNTYFYLVKK